MRVQDYCEHENPLPKKLLCTVYPAAPSSLLALSRYLHVCIQGRAECKIMYEQIIYKSLPLHIYCDVIMQHIAKVQIEFMLITILDSFVCEALGSAQARG